MTAGTPTNDIRTSRVTPRSRLDPVEPVVHGRRGGKGTNRPPGPESPGGGDPSPRTWAVHGGAFALEPAYLWRGAGLCPAVTADPASFSRARVMSPLPSWRMRERPKAQSLVAAMIHRHLAHQAFTLAAIDDVIGRGTRRDWSELRRAVLRDRRLLEKVLHVCGAHVQDPYAQRYHFWKHYAERHLA